MISIIGNKYANGKKEGGLTYRNLWQQNELEALEHIARARGFGYPGRGISIYIVTKYARWKYA